MPNRALLSLLSLALIVTADAAWARGGGGGGRSMGHTGFPGFPLRFAVPAPLPSGIVPPLLRTPTSQSLLTQPFVTPFATGGFFGVTPGLFGGSPVARTRNVVRNPGVHIVEFNGTTNAAAGFITVSPNTVPVSHGTLKIVEFNNVPQMSP